MSISPKSISILFDLFRQENQVPHVFGVQGGFSGLSEDANWIELTHDLVQEMRVDGAGVEKQRLFDVLCRKIVVEHG